MPGAKPHDGQTGRPASHLRLPSEPQLQRPPSPLLVQELEEGSLKVPVHQPNCGLLHQLSTVRQREKIELQNNYLF